MTTNKAYGVIIITYNSYTSNIVDIISFAKVKISSCSLVTTNKH